MSHVGQVWAKQKKYVCFRTDPDFLTVVFGFLQLNLLAENSFQFQVHFCCNRDHGVGGGGRGAGGHVPPIIFKIIKN